jgi:hypothetical protein
MPLLSRRRRFRQPLRHYFILQPAAEMPRPPPRVTPAIAVYGYLFTLILRFIIVAPTDTRYAKKMFSQLAIAATAGLRFSMAPPFSPLPIFFARHFRFIASHYQRRYFATPPLRHFFDDTLAFIITCHDISAIVFGFSPLSPLTGFADASH